MLNRLLLAVAAALWSLAGAAQAREEAPAAMEVVLYPSSAQVRAAETLPVRDGVVTFALPAGADVDSLVIALDKGVVNSRRVMPVPVEDSAAVAALRRELAQAREEAAALDGEMAAVKARIVLWSKGALAGDLPVAEMEKLDGALSGRMRELYTQSAALEPRIERAQANVRRWEQALSEHGGAATGLEVRALVGGATGDVRVRYAYTLSGCGWSPVYRFDAEPDKGLVRFAQQAQIRQRSGRDWTGVRLTLASGNPDRALRPNPLPAWRMGPMPQVDMSPEPMLAEAESMVAPNMMRKAAPVSPALERAAFTTWDLGVRDIPAGTPVVLDLAQGDWKAAFVRLARPGYGRKAAWLMAELHLPEAVDFPSGAAQYCVDGLPVGSGMFSLTGRQADMFFGTDARVVADMKQDIRRSGSKGFVGKRQTRVWKWTIEVTNNHAAPVAVRVEDPEPQIGDKAVDVKVVADPAPEMKDHVATWNLDVPASGKRVIDYAVEASAPEDMEFADGRE